MSNAVVTLKLSGTVGGLAVTLQKTLGPEINGVNLHGDVQVIPNTSEALVLGDVPAGHVLCIFNNEDAGGTAYCDIALDSGNTNKVSTLYPQEGIFLNRPPTGLYGKSSTGSTHLLICAVPVVTPT